MACWQIDVIAVETKHDNGRWSKGDHPICVGYVLMKNGVSVHHAGDVDMSTFEVFDQIGRTFQINATLLPKPAPISKPVIESIKSARYASSVRGRC